MLRTLFLSLLTAYAACGQPAELFGPEEVLNFSLRGDLESLLNDRGDNPSYHDLQVIWDNGKAGQMRAKVRGHFRKSKMNCAMPPLLIDFNGQVPGQPPLKLVTPCTDDKYVIREYVAYKMYQQLTDRSFRVRLAKVTFEETGKKPKSRTIFCFLIEDETTLASRAGLQVLDRDQVRPEITNRTQFLTMALFELFIANTDWSVQYRQNIKLLTDGKEIFTVPYDFDHSGLVWAPYAKPAPELEMGSVRERRYRGFCLSDQSEFTPVAELFRQKKEQLIAAFSHPLLDAKSIASGKDFLEEFYTILDSDKRRGAVLGYPCRPDGTGNVVIKGLRQ